MSSTCRYLWILPFLLTVANPTSSTSQSLTIYGSVVDSVTLEPIPYANVLIVGESIGTAADARGFFSLSGVPPGPHLITVTAVGYLSSMTRAASSPGGASRVDIRLSPTTVKLEEVLVTGQRKTYVPLPVAGMRRLEQSQLHAVPVPVQKDVIRSLLILPGIVSTSDVNSRFYVRGGGGDQNLFMLDGMRLYSPFHVLGMYSVFDPDFIRSVDVFTGAFPAGFGGRLSSIVSLTTIEPRADRIAAGVDLNLLSSKVQVHTPLSPSTRMFVHARHSLFPDTFKRLSGYDQTFSFYDVLAKVNADLLGPNSLSALILFTGDDLRSGDVTSTRYQWRNELIGVTLHGLVANRMYAVASLYVSRYSAGRFPVKGSAITPTSTDVLQPGFRLDATLYSPIPSDFLNFGVEFVVPRTSYSLVRSGGSKRDYSEEPPNELSGWFRAQEELGGALVETGVHLQFLNINRMGWWGVEPRVHVSRDIWRDWNVRLAYGRVSQTMVTANNEDDLIPIFDAWISLPRGAHPEFADHYIAGLDGTLTDGLSLAFQLYRKQYKNLVLYNRNKVSQFDPDFLPGSGKSSGVETTVRLSRNPVDVYCAYTLSRAEVSNAGMTYPPRYDIRHTANLLVQLQTSESFDVSVLWEFKSGSPFTQTMGFYNRLLLRDPSSDPFEDDPGYPYGILGPKNAARIPSYHRLDISVRYRFSLKSLSAEVGGSIINVYNRKNIFYYERKTGRRVNMMPLFPSMYLSISL